MTQIDEIITGLWAFSYGRVVNLAALIFITWLFLGNGLRRRLRLRLLRTSGKLSSDDTKALLDQFGLTKLMPALSGFALLAVLYTVGNITLVLGRTVPPSIVTMPRQLLLTGNLGQLAMIWCRSYASDDIALSELEDLIQSAVEKSKDASPEAHRQIEIWGNESTRHNAVFTASKFFAAWALTCAWVQWRCVRKRVARIRKKKKALRLPRFGRFELAVVLFLCLVVGVHAFSKTLFATQQKHLARVNVALLSTAESPLPDEVRLEKATTQLRDLQAASDNQRWWKLRIVDVDFFLWIDREFRESRESDQNEIGLAANAAGVSAPVVEQRAAQVVEQRAAQACRLAIADSWNALRRLSFDEAQTWLAKARRIATQDDVDRVRRMQTLRDLVQKFMIEVVSLLTEIQGNEELTIDGSEATVVSADANHITLILDGEKKRFAVNQIPAEIADAVAAKWMDTDDQRNLIAWGAFTLVTAPDEVTTELKVRGLWRQAESTGAQLDDLSEAINDVFALQGKRSQTGGTATPVELDDTQESLFGAYSKEMLHVSDDTKKANEMTLQLENTGIIKLLPRERYDGVIDVRGGGAYYSFTRLTHEYGFGSDLQLERDKFSVGFAGNDYGLLLDLEEKQLIDMPDLGADPPDDLPPATAEAWHFVWTHVVPSSEAELEAITENAYRGFTFGQTESVRAANSMAVEVGHSYLLRSINVGETDVIVLFRVIDRSPDRSVALVWRLLRQ